MRSKLLAIAFIVIGYSANSQHAGPNMPDTGFKPSGKLWGYSFFDYYYKAHADILNRGGANQYSNIEKGRNAFQMRRVYLGYNYAIHPRFSAELLLAAEDNGSSRTGVVSGDLLFDGKLSFYIKLANLRWKNIWRGTDVVIGQSYTPAYALLIEPIWGYRSIERTITDIRRVPSTDLGIALQGNFDPDNCNFGYNIMISNGTGARPENDKFKCFSGELYAKFFNKHLVFDLYADYQRLNWATDFHHARNMVKAFASYATPAFTAGVEAFINNGQKDVVGVRGVINDTLSAHAKCISIFVKGSIIKDRLNYFARADWYNPDVNYQDGYYDNYKGLTSTFEPNNKESFLTAGFDFMPVKNIHLMPNIWYNGYHSKQSNKTGTERYDYDLVYRATFYYVFGK